MDGIQDNGSGISIEGERINNLRFVDDIDIIYESWEALQLGQHVFACYR
jgi:hypothetical protein